MSSIINDIDNDKLILMGDFNAAPNSDIFEELQRMCVENNLIMTDICSLGPNSYTHLNYGSLSTSWLDHCLMSESLHNTSKNVNIDTSISISDHFPLGVTVQFSGKKNIHQSLKNEEPERINWKFDNLEKRQSFYEKLTEKLCIDFENECFSFSNVTCSNTHHKDLLSRSWNTFADSIVAVGREVFGSQSKHEHAVPGWDIYIRDFYNASMDAFLYWKNSGSPRNGPVSYAMRSARTNFKYALHQCRAEENRIRADSLAEKLTLNDVSTSSWKDIRKLQPGNKKLPTKIDDVSGESSIAELWRT